MIGRTGPRTGGFIRPSDFLRYRCDEGPKGYVINVKRKLGDIEVQEKACSGSITFLDSIRLFSIPFAQIDSHEGYIRCNSIVGSLRI